MAPSFGDRLAHAWNAFSNEKKEIVRTVDYGSSFGYSPARTRMLTANHRSIISAIYNRLAVDTAAIEMLHVKLDPNGRYVETVDSGLNECLTIQANIDQAATAFRQDIAQTLFEKGIIAVVPVDTDLDPDFTGGYQIQSMRVGTVVSWYPEHIRVSLYNQKTGLREEVTVAKKNAAIVENPFYTVMNEPNSTLQRLISKLNMLDAADDLASSGKLDMLIQLPYVIKSEARKEQAETRRKDIDLQLNGSKYGIAYIDGTEKVTQLNRPVENNLQGQVEYLTNLLFAQLGVTQEILNGTASADTMQNYRNRTIKPVVKAVTEAMKRSFLTKTARASSYNHSIEFFIDPFELVSIENIAEITDKFTRNEVLTANEVRGVIGFKPSTDSKANELRNSNMPPVEASAPKPLAIAPPEPEGDSSK